MRLSNQYEIINEFCQSAPVNLNAMATALGIKVQGAYLHDKISGMLERVRDDDYKITVNATHPHTRRRFTLAHELGHYMLHRHLVGDGIDDDKAYRSTEAGKYHNTLIGPEEETEANKFAASILMPRSLLEKEQLNGKTRVDILADKFEVSQKAMEFRLMNLGLSNKEKRGY